MSQQHDGTQSGTSTAFEQQAQKRSSGVIAEMFHFIRNSKKFWLVPLIIVLLLVGVIVILGSTALAPFIYTIF